MINKTKDKVDELKRQLKQIKRRDSLVSVNLNNLCIRPALKFSSKFKCPGFEKYDGKSYLYVHLMVYGVAMVRIVTITTF